MSNEWIELPTMLEVAKAKADEWEIECGDSRGWIPWFGEVWEKRFRYRARISQLEAENKLLRNALFDQLSDCINFDGGKLTDRVMRASKAVLVATNPKP